MGQQVPTTDSPLYDELLEILDRHEKGPPVVRGLLHHRAVPVGTQWRQWDSKGRMWIWISTLGIETLMKHSKEAKPIPVNSPEIFAFTGIAVYDMNDDE